MTSILTNTAAMSSLQALTTTQRALATTQAQVSSGLAVANASDNEAYWSIRQTMSAQLAGLASAQGTLSLTKSIADVTASALTSIISSVRKIQSDLVAVQSSGVALVAVQSDITAQQQSIIAVANAASFSGVNWLVGSASVDTTITDIRHTNTDHTTAQYSPTTQPGETFNEYADYASTTIGIDDYGGVVSSTYNSNGYWTVDNSGTTAHFTQTQTGSSSPGNYDFAFPSSQASSGLQFGSVDLTKIRLFANVSGSDEMTFHDDFTDGNPYETHTTTPTETYGSYQNVSALSDHILDQILVPGGGTPLNLDVTDLGTSDIRIAADRMSSVLAALNGAATAVGSVQNVVSTQQAYNSALDDSLTSGVGSLVDADMNVASTRLKALQTQQQLGIQALSIANQNSQLILKLFGQA